MTPTEKATKENEILTWMHKEGYDRRTSSAIAPIIVKYLDEVVKIISPNPDVSGSLPSDFEEWLKKEGWRRIKTYSKCIGTNGDGVPEYDHRDIHQLEDDYKFHKRRLARQ